MGAARERRGSGEVEIFDQHACTEEPAHSLTSRSSAGNFGRIQQEQASAAQEWGICDPADQLVPPRLPSHARWPAMQGATSAANCHAGVEPP